MGDTMKLKDAIVGKEYIITDIETEDEELNTFLFSLGCYSGEKITIILKQKTGCVVAIKDGRYSMDDQLAKAINVIDKIITDEKNKVKKI